MASTSPLVGPTEKDGMLLRVDDRLRVVEQTATLPAGVVAYVPNGQSSKLVWTGLPYQGGFSDYALGYAPGQYTKDAQGIVRLRGLTKFTPTGSYGTGSMGVTLPVGYRPAGGHEIFHVAGNSTADYHFEITIDTAGVINRVTIQGGNWDGVYMSYAGITFDSGSPLVVTASGAVIPDGWLFADGRAINPDRYGQLVARLGAAVLPDLRASAPAGTVPIIKF